MENNTLSFTFHILLPENIEENGQPVVLGNVKELGSWNNPIVKLRQPFPQNPTYWKSDPVAISVSNFGNVQYNYAIHTPKFTLFGREGKIIFEGIDVQDRRTLNIKITDQFDIWRIRGFAFVDYIYDSTEVNNFKDKVVEYQRLLILHNDLTIRASNPKFIINRIDNNLKGKRLFLCILLGYYISKREGSPYVLLDNFPSNLLLNAFEDYKQEILPKDSKDQMYTAILTLIKHNAFQMKFDWLIIFTIASEVDPDYTFIDHLKALKYSDENLTKFIKSCKMIKSYIENIKLESYVKIAKWLIPLCHNIDSLLKIWNDILFHNNEIDDSLFKCFIDRIQKFISNDEAVDLEYHFKSLSKDHRNRSSGVFRDQVIFLLKNPNRKWTYENIDAIKKLLHDNSLNWQRDEIIQTLELISQSRTLKLLNIFPEILDDWFRSDFSDTKEEKIPKICAIWFKNLLSKLNTITNNKNDSNFIFSVFQQLDFMYPLLGQRINIWRDLTAIAIDRVKDCSEDQIFSATKLIVQIKQDNVKELFLEMVKDILTIQQTYDQLLNKIRIICDCKTTMTLDVPNMISEDILYYIMTYLQKASKTSGHHNTILKYSNFWNIILRATGSVTKLNSNPFMKNIKTSINELAGLLIERTIDLKLLQQILKYDDEYLFRHFDSAVPKKKALGDVVVSRDEIETLRKVYDYYQIKLDMLSKFYSRFCPSEKVKDVTNYIRDVKQNLQSLDKIKAKQVFLSDHWAFHEKTLDSARNCYRFNRSQTFRNIFDSCIKKDAAAVNVEYIAQKLIPNVFIKYNAICKQLKDWEKLKCSEATLFWKNVMDINVELDLIKDYKISRSQKFMQTLDYVIKIPHWIQRLEELEKVVEMKVFKIPHDDDDWLSKAISNLKGDSMKLGQINNFFDCLSKNLSDINHDCWKLIKELSRAEEFFSFIKKIAEHDIKNLINGVDDNLDGRLIQENTISSLIEVKQFLFPLMNKNMESISDLLKELLNIIKKNHTLGEKIALCNGNNMALQNIYNNIQNREEVTKEKIKNAVLNGTFTFTRDRKEDKCLVSLQYPSKFNVKYNLKEILDLRGRALLIVSKPKNTVVINNKETEMFKDVIDRFVTQVDVALEIISTVSMLIQIGHFDFIKFEIKLQGTDMKDYLEFLKEEIKNWQDVIDRAQENCYYLTFFTARHVLSFYDYFTSEKSDEENEEECKTLIRFVNSKAQLPSHKDIQGISRESKDYFKVLCEIGNGLEKIFTSIPKQSRKLKATGQGIIIDLVRKGELFVASYTDKTRTPNIIMSLYANYGSYPEPWQLLICTTSTTMEELANFIRRSLFASNNGYENRLFCIANLESLDIELQYYFVDYVKKMQLKYTNESYLLAFLCCQQTGRSTNYILDHYSLEVREIDELNVATLQEVYQELFSNITCVSSDLSGQGKTEWIREVSHSKLKIPLFLISDNMDFKYLANKLKKCSLSQEQSLHINILSADCPEDVNLFLFELLTFKIILHDNVIVSIPAETFIFIEIASSIKHNLLNIHPFISYLPFKHLSWNIKDFKVSQIITSPIQVVCYFLNLYDNGKVDTEEIFSEGTEFIEDPLSEEIFVNILADQLIRFSSNKDFTLNNLIGETSANIANSRSTIIKLLLYTSKDLVIQTIKAKSDQLKFLTIKYEDEIVRSYDSNDFTSFFDYQNSLSLFYHCKDKVPDNIKLLLKLQSPGDGELADFSTNIELETILKELPNYAVTMDNQMKMALIRLRVKANIPVVICGDAGCGKTSLIAYLALVVEAQFLTLNLHAGIDEETIMIFMNDALKKAEKDETWILFDEINTCNHLGLLAELLSNKKFKDKPIHSNVRLFATCNPYRLCTGIQSEASKDKRYDENQINLVYQVKPLPDQILNYVWDFGIIKSNYERRYIQIIVEMELTNNLAHPVFSELLFASQNFIRKVEEPYSVSLRDIKRAITLVKFFYNSLGNRPAYEEEHKYPPLGNPTIIIRSYILALSICYHSRLYNQDLRKQYRCEMEQILRNHEIYIEENMFSKIICEEQEDYINRMQCPPDVANNEALLENVLATIVCILTRIPLFLIGAPGSSKSLAIRLINSNLRGSGSNDKYFRTLPQIYLIPYQCTLSSTSDGIMKIFDKANRYQKTASKQFPIASVVLLDNVDLAEESPFNPLKVLHSLLEPSYPATEQAVSVIGISNWRLDISKSSRALIVQRPQINLDDLVDTAECLLNTRAIGHGQKVALEPLAKAYSNFEKYDQALSNFHGLRDYYALVKRLSINEMTPENIQMALARNFGGTQNHVKLCEKYFGNVLELFNNHNSWSYKQIPIEKLIDSNLNDSDARHLMIIGKSDSIVNLLTYHLRKRNLDSVVILGSQFPNDRNDYSYNVLNRIMMCVETGKLLILTDLEIIYGNLYDLWNQNCIGVRDKEKINYFTRVALGAYAYPMFYVSPNFKCIVVMDENNLASVDPSLLNRFEKQKLSINDMLDDRQKLLVKYLYNWTNQITTLVKANSMTGLHNKFAQEDLFIGFDKNETLQSLIFNITMNNPEANDNEILEKCKESLIAIASPDGIIRAELSILDQDEVDRWKYVYFKHHHHNGLFNYFDALFDQEKLSADSKGQLVIINTFSKINIKFKSCLQDYLKCQVYNLSTIKTEVQITNVVKNFFFESNDKVLILQCDINTINTKCIKLVKYIIEQFRNEFLAEKEKCESNMPIKYACIIFHIQRDYEPSLIKSNFICGWNRITIESLEPPEIPLIDLLDKSLHDIINSELFDKIVNSTMPFERILEELLLQEHYHSNESHMDPIRKEILNDSHIMKCIKTKTFEWILGNYKNWQCGAALNKKDLSMFTCFSIVLQNYIKKIIKHTIYKILYSIEKLPEIERIFKNESNEKEVVHLWKQSFIDKIVKINYLFEQRLSVVPSEMIEFPFSYYFLINYYKRYYYEELDILTQDSENIQELIEDHIGDFRNNLIFIHPNFDNLQKCSELYYDDFIRIILSTYSIKSASKEKLDFIFRYLIGDKFADDPFILHIYWWKYATEILIQLKLVETFPDLIIKAQNDFIVYGKLDRFLFKESINLILQNICDDKPWKQDMDVILSINNCKIENLKNFSNLNLLLICNDLLKINSIPLEKIKEIIYLGKSANKQEFITTDIINLVFSDLDNNNNIIPITSFITRSLKLISLESEIRGTLYRNIFSQYSFKLMNDCIIEKIFETEIQQNEQIFFMIIKNPEEALQLSIRLKTINDNIKYINSNMAEFCCEIIQKIFSKFKLNELLPYFKNSIDSLMKQENLPLQQITSIAFLKEFINKYWKNYFQEDNSLSKSLIKEINDIMKISDVQSINSYFILDLYKKNSFNIKQFEILKKEFICFENQKFIDIETNTNTEMNLLPKLWKPVRKVDFKDLYTFYIANLNEYPFLSLFFKHYNRLKLIKYLYPIIRFVKILNSKLEYHLTREAAQIMSFHEFIKKESVDEKEYINLKSLFEEFAFGWNSVISHINQYQSEVDKPFMTLDLPVIFGLVEQKDGGVYLCAIVEFLIKLHNEFLNDVMAIPIEKCKSFNFIKDFSWNCLNSKIYFTTSTVTQTQEKNFINYEWSDKILKYNQRNQRNLNIEDNVDFIFDLQKIEIKLARKLILYKIYFEMENNQFYLKNFSFMHELFHNSSSILFNIKRFLPQEPILADKMKIVSSMFQKSIILNNPSNSINLSELLLLFEIILCFVKELSIKNNNILILNLVNQWLKLARYNVTYTDIFKEFSLKHIIAFYELIEEHVANSVICDIDDKFKIPLTQYIMDSINNIIDYHNSENQQLIPAKAFVLALKRFIYRYLLIDSNIENMSLHIYFLDFTLNLWISNIKEELIKELFPTCLLVSHAYNSYVYLLDEIEKASNERQNSRSFAYTSLTTTRKTLIKKYKKFTD
ncbi:hypothetical protein GLOIN_2v432849 [Rhizophagus irregularis DAOM 181602=DAOM 197198]|nr:hypothetical protein GLOIN_2v432849 [Rhizophagus irregularis DAOM 181602=DAOM 197198]